MHFKKQKDAKLTEEMEKLKDDFHEQYYTNRAKTHLNRILETYNRQSQQTYHTSLNSIKNLGLFNPCADNINYLKHMRWVSVK
jgi:inhibitor of KinA sporulation pathway (predicted exonuclease)